MPLLGRAGPGTSHWHIPVSDKTVHWGYFSRKLKPVVEIGSGDYVTIECLTHCAGDDYERMIKGDAGAESVYYWTQEQKNVDRRGAGSRSSWKVICTLETPGTPSSVSTNARGGWR